MPPAAKPDLVYPVRSGENEEFRYSLRSVAKNAAGLFRKVWAIGTDLPEWLTGVEVIEAGAVGKAADIRAKITAAVTDRRVASRIVIMTDDAYLIDPIDEWPAFHMGPTSVYAAKLRREGMTDHNRWLRTLLATAEWMAEQGHGDILARQGHRPLLWDKRRLAGALAAYPADRLLDVVGLYDIAGAGGEGRFGTNAKIGADPAAFHARMAELDIPWLSSNDRSFAEGMVGGFVRGLFRQPCRFEA